MNENRPTNQTKASALLRLSESFNFVITFLLRQSSKIELSNLFVDWRSPVMAAAPHRGRRAASEALEPDSRTIITPAVGANPLEEEEEEAAAPEDYLAAVALRAAGLALLVVAVHRVAAR